MCTTLYAVQEHFLHGHITPFGLTCVHNAWLEEDATLWEMMSLTISGSVSAIVHACALQLLATVRFLHLCTHQM